MRCGKCIVCIDNWCSAKKTAIFFGHDRCHAWKFIYTGFHSTDDSNLWSHQFKWDVSNNLFRTLYVKSGLHLLFATTVTFFRRIQLATICSTSTVGRWHQCWNNDIRGFLFLHTCTDSYVLSLTDDETLWKGFCGKWTMTIAITVR